jgi:hypothetical protein
MTQRLARCVCMRRLLRLPALFRGSHEKQTNERLYGGSCTLSLDLSSICLVLAVLQHRLAFSRMRVLRFSSTHAFSQHTSHDQPRCSRKDCKALVSGATEAVDALTHSETKRSSCLLLEH